ncbi:MAG: hypothetical protein ACRC5C_05545, partial [Bacilli bacterium]
KIIIAPQAWWDYVHTHINETIEGFLFTTHSECRHSALKTLVFDQTDGTWSLYSATGNNISDEVTSILFH